MRQIHLSLFWAILNQSTSSNPVSLRTIVLWSSYLCLGLPSVSFLDISSPNLIHFYCCTVHSVVHLITHTHIIYIQGVSGL